MAATIYIRPDGPYIVTGEFKLEARGAPRDDASAVLCRCGRSANLPHCDGTHARIGFVDPALLPASEPSIAAQVPDRLTITPLPNGPLRCDGPLTLSGASSRKLPCRDVRLCRCGGSATKPFCDDSHATTGFVG